MSACTYDNPATMARECWQDGKLICHYAFQLLQPFAKKPIPAEHFFFGANIGPWKLGQMVGDAEAMSSNVEVSRSAPLLAQVGSTAGLCPGSTERNAQ